MSIRSSLRWPLLLTGMLLAVQISASPQVPSFTLNLDMLDRNGTPFRYFHLRTYHAQVLDPVVFEAPMSEDARITHSDSGALHDLPSWTGLMPPGTPADDDARELLRDGVLDLDEEMLSSPRSSGW